MKHNVNDQQTFRHITFIGCSEVSHKTDYPVNLSFACIKTMSTPMLQLIWEELDMLSYSLFNLLLLRPQLAEARQKRLAEANLRGTKKLVFGV